MKVTAEVHQSKDLITFLHKLGSPELKAAAIVGLNEHAGEQRKQSVNRIVAYTGIPKGRVGGKTKLIKASASGSVNTAIIRTADVAIPLAEYGNAVWTRDLNPFADGQMGGSVSSMKGAEATGWNVRRQFPGAFIANGQVVIRRVHSDPRSGLRTLYAPVLANELAKPERPNVPAAERYAAMDLERRVMAQVIRVLGT
jgi:hypothetical protein